MLFRSCIITKLSESLTLSRIHGNIIALVEVTDQKLWEVEKPLESCVPQEQLHKHLKEHQARHENSLLHVQQMIPPGRQIRGLRLLLNMLSFIRQITLQGAERQPCERIVKSIIH